MMCIQKPLTYFVFQLISAHNQELEELQLKLKNQHNRQRAELREKMNARRARKKKALSNRQEMEEEREKLEQKKELTKVQAKAVSIFLCFQDCIDFVIDTNNE